MGLKWMSIFCPKAKYVLKTDDDIFVNIPFLLEALQKESSKFSNRITGKEGQFIEISFQKYYKNYIWCITNPNYRENMKGVKFHFI